MGKSERFKRILIANRGEISLRIIKACKQLGIKTTAVYAKDDRNRLIEEAADEYICLPGDSPFSTYLNTDRIVKTAKERKADAIHPGYGFLSENPLFARACEQNRIAFIGPPSAVLENVADKINARRTAQRLGLRTIPGSDILHTEEEALSFAREHGYPLIIKSCYGGGGRGIRIARNKKELLKCIETASAEVSSSFGLPDIYAEKYLGNVRHVEFQFMADKHGNTVHLFDRECSIQRRFQKLIEEAPSKAISGSERKRIGNIVRSLAKSTGYAGAGTAEFLLTPDGKTYFLEINPRVQVEHGVTEMITGIDIVKEQIRVAQGLPLSVRQKDIRIKGHAIECRIVAECARRNFAPSGGTAMDIRLGKETKGGRARIDHALYNGLRINPSYDSLLAKLIVWGRSREEAIKNLGNALASMRIDGVQNTIDFYNFLIRQKKFTQCRLNTSFITDNDLLGRYTKKTLNPEVIALIASAIYEHEAGHEISFTRPGRWVERSRKDAVGLEEGVWA